MRSWTSCNRIPCWPSHLWDQTHGSNITLANRTTYLLGPLPSTTCEVAISCHDAPNWKVAIIPRCSLETLAKSGFCPIFLRQIITSNIQTGLQNFQSHHPTLLVKWPVCPPPSVPWAMIISTPASSAFTVLRTEPTMLAITTPPGMARKQRCSRPDCLVPVPPCTTSFRIVF